MENFTNLGFETVQKPVRIDMLTYAGSAFGSTVDGEQVFINGRIVDALNLYEGVIAMGHLVPNFPDKRAQIPWRAMRMTLPEDQEPMVEEEVIEEDPTPSISDTILKHIQTHSEHYFTTSDLAEDLGMDTTTISNWCMSLHNRGLISRADFHAGPNQKRASFVMWGLNSKSFAS